MEGPSTTPPSSAASSSPATPRVRLSSIFLPSLFFPPSPCRARPRLPVGSSLPSGLHNTRYTSARTKRSLDPPSGGEDSLLGHSGDISLSLRLVSALLLFLLHVCACALGWAPLFPSPDSASARMCCPLRLPRTARPCSPRAVPSWLVQFCASLSPVSAPRTQCTPRSRLRRA